MILKVRSAEHKAKRITQRKIKSALFKLTKSCKSELSVSLANKSTNDPSEFGRQRQAKSDAGMKTVVKTQASIPTQNFGYPSPDPRQRFL